MATRGRKPKTVLTAQQEVEIIDAYTAKTSTARELAEMYGINDSSFYRMLKRYRVAVHQRPDKNGKVHITKIDPKEFEVPVMHPAEMAVVVDKENLVQKTTRPGHRLETWEVKYEGTVLVEADDIEEAIREARKLGVVKRISSVRTVKGQ
jgi:transposase